MNQQFQPVEPQQIKDNPFQLIGQEWMLITAGTLDKHNTMTASWGGFGYLWGENVVLCVVRPSRYTYEFMEKADRFTLSFFTDTYHDALSHLGNVSGRDSDKIAEAGLTPVSDQEGLVYFQEARLVIECTKMYTQDMDPGRILDPEIHRFYPEETNYHRIYIGKITRCIEKIS